MKLAQRHIVLGAAVAFIVTLLAVVLFASGKQEALLFGGMSQEELANVTQKLEANGIRYRVQADSIYVAEGRRDQVRMLVSSAGGRSQASQGYELLDGLSRFSTTAQVYNSTYWRAVEGELANTISSLENVTDVRVHLSHSAPHQFGKSTLPSASVVFSSKNGRVNPSSVTAIRNLVSSSVSGLDFESVSVFESQMGLVSGGEFLPDSAVQSGIASDLKSKVERLLDAHVGPGNSIVEVSVEINRERRFVREELVDPDSQTIVSSDRESVETQSSDESGGVTEAASNLPDRSAAESSGASSSSEQKSREIVNYDLSRTVTEAEESPGQIERISVGVLINQSVSDTQDLSFDEGAKEDLRLLIESAVGLVPERGDLITLKVLPFAQLLDLGAQEPALGRDNGVFGGLSNEAVAVGIAGLVFAIIGLAFFLSRSRRRSTGHLEVPQDELEPQSPAAVIGMDAEKPAETLESEVPPNSIDALTGSIERNGHLAVLVLEEWLSAGSQMPRKENSL